METNENSFLRAAMPPKILVCRQQQKPPGSTQDMIHGTALTLPFWFIVIGLVVFRILEIIQIQVLQEILKD